MFYGNMGRLKASELPRASLEVRCAGFVAFSAQKASQKVLYIQLRPQLKATKNQPL